MRLKSGNGPGAGWNQDRQTLSRRKPVPPYDFRAAMVPVGAINAADSLAAIKMLIFDERNFP